jgi:hypothetical protein
MENAMSTLSRVTFPGRPGRLGLALTAALSLSLSLAGCGEESECGEHSHDPICLGCTGEEDPAVPGTTKEGNDGVLSIRLVSVDPEEQIVGTGSLVVEVLDASDTLVPGVTFTKVEPFYPEGGHSTPIVPVVTPVDGFDGRYEITEVNYVHAGIWELRFELSAPGELDDQLAFEFCIAGEDEH